MPDPAFHMSYQGVFAFFRVEYTGVVLDIILATLTVNRLQSVI